MPLCNIRQIYPIILKKLQSRDHGAYNLHTIVTFAAATLELIDLMSHLIAGQ